ncbi:MAG: hypothetical protein WAN17_13320 [Candidatus Sulfotelmatobacter sp.]
MANFPNRCQHIKVNGTQCGCPALRHNKLCYFHKRNHEERIELDLDRLKNAHARRRKVVMELPVLEDANSIQVSLMQIMRLIISGQIDGKTAGLLLYALQTASANLPRVRFDPFMHDVVLDPKTVNETPLSAHVWEDSDFRTAEDEEEDEAVMQVQALEEAQRKARKKAELDRWAEAEANRLTKDGARQREAERQAELKQDAEERAAAATPENAIPAKPAPHQGKRPPSNVSLDEVRKSVTAQIRKALPAIAAAVRENGDRSG